MEPGSLIPAADTIPIAAGWFWLLLLATFALHLLAMNAMLGGAVIALVRALTAAGGPQAEGADHVVSRKLPFVIALTVNLGVPPLLFLSVLYGNFIYVSAVLMAVWWIAIFMLAMGAYYAAYVYDFKFAALGRARGLVIGLAVLLLLAVGFILTNSMTLMLKPGAWTVYFDNPHGTVWNLSEPTLWPRYLHFVLSSLAVGGLALALLGAWRAKRGMVEATSLVRQGLAWFTWATLVQAADGLWFLFSLPPEIMQLFVGGSGLHTAVLWLGVALAVVALLLAAKNRPWPAAGAILAAVVLMVITRDLVRQAYLLPHFSPASLSVTGQGSPALVFWVCLMAGAAAIIWVLRLAAGAGKEP